MRDIRVIWRPAVGDSLLILMLSSRRCRNHSHFTVLYILLVIFRLLAVFQNAVLMVKAEENEEYKGKYLGKLNVYHHQVAGDVYAVDRYALLLKSFSYDGYGADTFFWAGASNRPGPQGFIVPDEYGKTNVLKQYHNKDFILTLPDNKEIQDIKWFAVYDLSTQNTFGDIYIPEEFDPPMTKDIGQLNKNHVHNVSSKLIEILDAKTIRIKELVYDGLGQDTYFWIGPGTRPSPKGIKVPDEYGYLDPLHAYKSDDVVIQLPGGVTIFDIEHLSIYDVKTKTSFGSVSFQREGLNVPPSLVKVIKQSKSMPNCVQLHKRLQIGWDIFGPQITIQLVGQIAENEYMAFGLSGSNEKSQMEGADVTIAYMDGTRGYATDYTITSKAPCTKVLGQYRGVCKDEFMGGQDSNQLFTASRENEITTVTYRRLLISPDLGDKAYVTDQPIFIVWAVGKLDENNEPSFHDTYPKRNVFLELGRLEPKNTCMDFTADNKNLRKPWQKEEIFDRSIRIFRATIGPSGGKRGYQGITGQATTGLAWYINGLIAPELYLRRGLTYIFQVYGGNNPHSSNLYHPLIVTDECHGGYGRLSDVAQMKVRVLAGVEFTRRGRPMPTAVGPLCLSKHNNRDRRLDDDFLTFKKFNRTLIYSCEPGEAGVLEVTPNSSWPDTVYYNSFTHANMGWKIHIVDYYSKNNSYNSLNSSFILMLLTIIVFFS
ncbi:protein Skeletor, isoforms B/C isoform X1 [Copidosoma floridanum]|uniref:protein Skeletor, isoforms B/C isoform X1 n=2 Tax=Copidosoma floridanum TaxID=29053 RepID=UPI000C6F6FD2|nr:protein Skeletor, isoforms B/C isoform X1 [Copidosoma floridanum]